MLHLKDGDKVDVINLLGVTDMKVRECILVGRRIKQMAHCTAVYYVVKPIKRVGDWECYVAFGSQLRTHREKEEQ